MKYLKSIFRKLYKLAHPQFVSIDPIYTNAQERASRIPNRVYQTWKEAALPAVHALELKRFRNRNMDYSFEFFDDARMSEYMRTYFADHPILEVFSKITVPAAKADIWRYCILYREGGIYCDIDSSLSIPFRDLLGNDPSELLSFEGNPWKELMSPETFSAPNLFLSKPPASIVANLEYPDNTILNWLLCFEKDHPILKETIDLIVENFPFLEGKDFGNLWQAVIHGTGPLVFTQAVWRWMDKTGIRPAQCGIDFNGKGIFKIPGSGDRYRVSPHYLTMKKTKLTGI